MGVGGVGETKHRAAISRRQLDRGVESAGIDQQHGGVEPRPAMGHRAPECIKRRLGPVLLQPKLRRRQRCFGSIGCEPETGLDCRGAGGLIEGEVINLPRRRRKRAEGRRQWPGRVQFL